MRGRAWNAGAGAPLSVLDVVVGCRASPAGDLEPDVQGSGTPHGEIDRQFLDSTAIRDELGWRPALDLDEGLAQHLRVVPAAPELMAAPAARAPDAVAPPPGNPRFPLVDSLRALGFLMVFTVHATGQAGIFKDPAGVPWYAGYVTRLEVALPLFFAISAFLLYRPFVAGLVGSARRPRIRSFARARALRIIPAFWVAMTIAAIYPGITGWLERALVGLLPVPPGVRAGLERRQLPAHVASVGGDHLLRAVAAAGADRSALARAAARIARPSSGGSSPMVVGLYALSVLARVMLTAAGYEAEVGTVPVSPREAYSICCRGRSTPHFPRASTGSRSGWRSRSRASGSRAAQSSPRGVRGGA